MGLDPSFLCGWGQPSGSHVKGKREPLGFQKSAFHRRSTLLDLVNEVTCRTGDKPKWALLTLMGLSRVSTAKRPPIDEPASHNFHAMRYPIGTEGRTYAGNSASYVLVDGGPWRYGTLPRKARLVGVAIRLIYVRKSPRTVNRDRSLTGSAAHFHITFFCFYQDEVFSVIF